LNLEQEHVKKQKTSEEAPEIEKSTEKIPEEKMKEMMQLVELKRLYEPDPEDQLWTQTHNFMHAPVEWKLYDLCGVHQVTDKDKDIFMLSKFEADFKQQQSKMTNTIDTFLKAINDRMTEETKHVFGLSDGTKSYPVGILKNLEVHIGKLKLLKDFYVNDMEKDLVTPLLVGRGFLATASAVIDCKKANIVIGEGVTSSRPSYYAKKDLMDYHLPGEWEIAKDVELNPFKDVLVFRKMVEFLGIILINLKGNMWDSEELIEKRIDRNRPPKKGDGAWHIRTKLIDPDGEKFNRAFQSIPIIRNLLEKENPSEINDLQHFHDSYECDSKSSKKTR
nr:hypothetical protein [Tanacetum cinerariifolium]